MITEKDKQIAKTMSDPTDMAHYKNKCFGKTLNYISGWLSTIGCANKETLLETLKNVYYD